MSCPLTKYHERQLDAATRENTDFFNVPPGLYWAKPVYTYDGDTLHVVFKFMHGKMQKWRVRLSGIDTCEMKAKRSWSKERRRRTKARAVEIRDYVKGLVENQIVKVEAIKFEKYGRLLCNLYFGANHEVNLSDHLIAVGMAVPYFGGTKAKVVVAPYVAAEGVKRRRLQPHRECRVQTPLPRKRRKKCSDTQTPMPK